jgi:hypothetical protein
MLVGAIIGISFVLLACKRPLAKWLNKKLEEWEMEK